MNAAIPLRYADAAELIASVASGLKLLTSRGSLVADRRTNSLLVRDSQSAIRQLRAWIAEVDIPLGQIELAAHIVTMNQQSLRELGVKWGYGQRGKGALSMPTWQSARQRVICDLMCGESMVARWH